MKPFNRRTMLSTAPAAVAAVAIAAGNTVAQGSPASDKVAGITRLPGTNNFTSLIVRHGNVAYTSGLLATDSTQNFLGQAKQVFARIDGALASFGSSKENLLSVTIVAKAIANKPAFNKAYLEWLGSAGLPARVFAVDAEALEGGALIEIQVTAACPPA